MVNRSLRSLERAVLHHAGQEALPLAPPPAAPPPSAPTLPSPAPSAPPTERQGGADPPKRLCARCGVEAAIRHTMSVQAFDHEGIALVYQALLCAFCVVTVFACWERGTLLTPVVVPPDDVLKQFCGICRTRVWGTHPLCDACLTDERSPSDG
jgi:hypothetical protein